MAIVRRAGLELRDNLKNSAYGYINVLRIETSQALAEAFKVMEAPDVRAQFGAENAWDAQTSRSGARRTLVPGLFHTNESTAPPSASGQGVRLVPGFKFGGPRSMSIYRTHQVQTAGQQAQ